MLTTHEAFMLQRSVSVSKAAGPDNIPNIVFKLLSLEFAPILADLYNSSLQDGYPPSYLKCASVCPLPKMRPPKSIETDIRPLSLPSQVAKLMEEVYSG